LGRSGDGVRSAARLFRAWGLGAKTATIPRPRLVQNRPRGASAFVETVFFTCSGRSPDAPPAFPTSQPRRGARSQFSLPLVGRVAAKRTGGGWRLQAPTAGPANTPPTPALRAYPPHEGEGER